MEFENINFVWHLTQQLIQEGLFRIIECRVIFSDECFYLQKVTIVNDVSCMTQNLMKRVAFIRPGGLEKIVKSL